MANEYKIEWKILDTKYIKADGTVLEVEYQISVEKDGVSKSKKNRVGLYNPKEKPSGFLPLKNLTEELVITWVKNDGIYPYETPESFIKQLKVEVDRELASLFGVGLTWTK